MIRRMLPEIGLRICALPHDHGAGQRKPTPKYREDNIITREAHSIAHVALSRCPKKRVKSRDALIVSLRALVHWPLWFSNDPLS